MAYLKFQKTKGMKPSGISYNPGTLNSVLRFIGNGAMDMTKMRFAQNFLKQMFQRYDPIPDEKRAKIIHFANIVDDSDRLSRTHKKCGDMHRGPKR